MAKYKKTICVGTSYTNHGKYGRESSTTIPHNANEDKDLEAKLNWLKSHKDERDSNKINQLINELRTFFTKNYIYPDCLSYTIYIEDHCSCSWGAGSTDRKYYQTHYFRPTIEMLIINKRKLLMEFIDEIKQCQPEFQEAICKILEESLKHTDFNSKLFSWDESTLNGVHESIKQIEDHANLTSAKKKQSINVIVSELNDYLNTDTVKNLHQRNTNSFKLDILKTKLHILSVLDREKDVLAQHENKFYRLFNLIVSKLTDNKQSMFYVNTTSLKKIAKVHKALSQLTVTV